MNTYQTAYEDLEKKQKAVSPTSVSKNQAVLGAEALNKKYTSDTVPKSTAQVNDPLVQINKYVPSNGIYDLAWNDAEKKVLIGGMDVPYEKIDSGGNAWVRQSVADNAMKNVGNKTGIVSPTEQFDTWKQNYGAKLENQMDEISNRQFTFTEKDLAKDPVWQAYERTYLDQADRAFRDTLAKVAARTGGNISSMARAQAQQMQQYYLDQMTDKIPEIAQLAWERYSGDLNNDMDVLDRRTKLYGGYYTDESNASAEALSRLYDGQDRERLRQEQALSDKMNGYEFDSMAYTMADAYNVPISPEMAQKYGVEPNADGTYPTPNQIVIAKEQEYWDKYKKGEYTDQQYIALMNDLELLKQKTTTKKTTTKKTTQNETSNDWW